MIGRQRENEREGKDALECETVLPETHRPLVGGGLQHSSPPAIVSQWFSQKL